MGIIAPALIGAVARKLFQKYLDDEILPRETTDLLLGPSSIEDTLKKLIDQKFLDFGGATELSEFGTEILSHVMDKLTAIQNETGILKADGVLGERTLKWFLNRRFGHHHRDIKTLPKSTTKASPGSGSHVIRYFIENDQLPTVGNLSAGKTLQLFSEAWSSWVQICNLSVRQSGVREEANVIVNVKVLGPPASVLAIADVGPPGKHQLELTFDKAETWTPFTFEATACHEIGHILGIQHRNVQSSRQLMNDTLHDDIKTPQTEDKAAAVHIWGPSKD